MPFESALYSLCMEVLLVTPLDMKNMRRWVHQSLAEVERERKELIDVFDYLRILPGFYMTDTPRKNMGSSPLEFFRRFVDDRKWKEKWGKGWLGRDGKFLPSLPRERLLHAFFFAEGIEGGPDYECKMMEREDKLMRRFLQLEALSKERGQSTSVLGGSYRSETAAVQSRIAIKKRGSGRGGGGLVITSFVSSFERPLSLGANTYSPTVTRPPSTGRQIDNGMYVSLRLAREDTSALGVGVAKRCGRHSSY